MDKARRDVSWHWFDVVLILLMIVGGLFIFQWLQPYIYYTLVYNYGLPDSGISEFIIAFVAQFVITLAAIVIVLGLYRHMPWRQVGFRLVPWRYLMSFGLGGGLLTFFVVLLVGMLIQHLTPVPPQDFEEVLRQAGQGSLFVLVAFIGVVVAPFYEEVLFRGVIYGVLRQYAGVGWGIVLSALLFALIHFDLVRMLPLALGGVALAAIYQRTGSIYCSWAAHGVWNLMMALSLYFSR